MVKFIFSKVVEIQWTRHRKSAAGKFQSRL